MITNMTFISLSVLLILALYSVYSIFKALGKHDKIIKPVSTLNTPLKNSNKPWYNK